MRATPTATTWTFFLRPPRGPAATPPLPHGSFACLRHLSRSTALQELLCGGGGRRRRRSSPAACDTKALLRDLDLAVGARRIDAAWEAFDRLRASCSLLPPRALLGGLIAATSYSPEPRRLRRAYQLASALSLRRPDLLHYDSLSRLALSLARAQMSVPSAAVLRLMLETNRLPPPPLWSAAFSHLVRTPVGSYAAADVLIDLCGVFLCHPASSKRRKLTKPSAALFNLVLHSCVQFGSPLKAHQMLEIMPETGVEADVGSIIAIARVCEMNGLREDLKKLKPHVDSASSPLLNHHYLHFYDSLLSLHFKFNDLEAAAELILGLYQRSSSPPRQNVLPETCFLLRVGSDNLKTGSKLLIKPASLPQDLAFKPENRSGLIILKDGKLFPSDRAIAKLINGYVRQRKVGELSKVLIGIHKTVGTSSDFSLGSEVVVSFVELGWLETAHDILDDMESAGVSFPEITYASLLMAYCKKNMPDEARVLMRQMRERGLINLPDEEAIILFPSVDAKCAALVTSSALAKLLEKQSMEEEEGTATHLIYEFNFSILFFCKAGMMEDAIKTFRKMQERKVEPTVQTFGHLVNGYSSLEMYREITIIWGEIKRWLEVGVLSPDRDLFECLLWNFIRGGYFERAMEIARYMEESHMYVDKWRFRREFLKLHKNLYRNLNMSNARTDAQSKRLEHVRAFRKWVGIARAKRIGSNG
ncbi:unnamed protein product [Spirodela intermedia]|uniref:At1g68980-like TPR repeats domain-containing protein n=1 Tax=Spirodela intermedia TaxID=51605 RepID=A0A7I8L3B1_SPIIN|nr:unnamed protein product [Spirodela intermedia]